LDTFDFEESINIKEKSMRVLSTKSVGLSLSVSVEEVGGGGPEKPGGAGREDDKTTKKFVNGIDMFAENLDIAAENYNVRYNDYSCSWFLVLCLLGVHLRNYF